MFRHFHDKLVSCQLKSDTLTVRALSHVAKREGNRSCRTLLLVLLAATVTVCLIPLFHFRFHSFDLRPQNFLV